MNAIQLDICHRIEVHQDNEGYYAEVYDNTQRLRIHTTRSCNTHQQAYKLGVMWDRSQKYPLAPLDTTPLDEAAL
jgi:hypothetical protein